MVMTIEGTDVNPIVSHEAQENDNVINLCNTCLRTLHQFPLLFEWRPTSNIETLKTLPKFWISERMTIVRGKCLRRFLMYYHTRYQRGFFHSSKLCTIVRCNFDYLSQFLILARIIRPNGNIYSSFNYILLDFCLIYSRKKSRNEFI